LALDPQIRNPFEFLDPILLRNISPQSSQYMNVVFHPTDSHGRAFQFQRNPAQIGMQRRPHCPVAKKRSAIFGRKHGMNVNSGERLRHKVQVG
jgi:hypothetical protein